MLDNGHLLDQVLRKSGTFPRTVHKELGIILRKKMLLEFAESGHPIFRSTTPLSRVRIRQKRMSNIAEDCTEHSIIWGMFMATTLNAATFMGKSYSTMRNVVQNGEKITLKQMFEISAATINNDEEVYCLDKIEYQRNTWTKLSLINDPVVIGLQSTKVYVFSDSVLCLGKVLQHPECNQAWKDRVAGARAERDYSDFDDIKGEPAEFEWNIFPGFTTLQLCDKINDLLSSLGQTPEKFTGRILFYVYV